MGRSKALLDAGGASFLARAVGALRDGGCHPVLVVLRHPGDGDAGGARDPAPGPEADVARDAGARVVLNRDPADGPISSIRAALDTLEAPTRDSGPAVPVDAIAVLPVDHPGVRSETVAALLSALEEAGDTAILLPEHDGRSGHPVLFARGVFPELRAPGLAEGARTVVRRDPGRVRQIPVDDPAIHQDIDRPADYRAWYGATA